MFNQEPPKGENPTTAPAFAPVTKAVSPSSIDAEERLKQAVDNNSQPSPQLSLDPESSKMSVVGDVNDVQPTNGDYNLTFIYAEDEVSDADKQKMKKDAEGNYSVTVTYTHRRVKPLYRTKVTLLVARIFSDMGVITVDGYNSDMLANKATETLVEHIEDLADIARMVLGIPREQMEYMSGDELAIFFSQLLENEPNILKEAVVFLEQQLKETAKATDEKPVATNEKPSTQQG